MSCEATERIWFNGELVEWKDATIHVLSHVIHYGSSVFEGIRCYKNRKGSAIFRLREHVKRLFDSAKIYRMDIPYTEEEICDAIIETVRVNGLEECYIRPVVYRGYGEMGVNPLKCPVEVAIAAWEWGAYLGAEALQVGVDAGVSTWRRMAPDTMPNLAKAGGNYLNSQLSKMEAIRHGYDEAIMLDYHGCVSEGSGENIFLVIDGDLYTPPVNSSLLRGITRDSVIKIAGSEGIAVREEQVPREMLYLADEIFFTGTAAEITPVKTVDGIEIGSGRRGPITELLQKKFFSIIRDEDSDIFEWLTYI